MFTYNVKFVCGKAATRDFIVNPGMYTTEINILNYHNEKTAELVKFFIPVVMKNRAIAREPKFEKPHADEKNETSTKLCNDGRLPQDHQNAGHR